MLIDDLKTCRLFIIANSYHLDFEQLIILYYQLAMYSCCKVIVFALILIFINCVTQTKSSILWPEPKSFSSQSEGLDIQINPCEIKYIISAPAPTIVQDIIDYYKTAVFKCEAPKDYKLLMNVVVMNTSYLIATKVEHQAYEITLRTNLKWQLQANYYAGFLRGFETFSQLFQLKQKNGKEYEIRGLPIIINDIPDYVWRGLMIDSTDHYMSIELIKKTINAMMFLKLNVLHWHIVDDVSFPLFIPEIPELSEYGQLSGIYSVQDVKQIIRFANSRGIRVIPEIDTPGHCNSWGRSPKYQQITMTCNDYEGQLDPTLNLSMQVVAKLLQYMNQTFDDEYAHFGGDQVDYECWGKRPSIIEYMKQHNISTFLDLSIDFRIKQKQIWRSISEKKKVMYWANEDIDLPLEDDDVISWWGLSQNAHFLSGRPNEIVLSYWDLNYLDIGFGDRNGEVYSSKLPFQHWRKMYQFDPRVPNANVIGGQTCIWSELDNDYTHDQKVFLRAGITGQRLWNVKIDIKTSLNNVVRRLVAQKDRLKRRGYRVAPVTVQLCENNVDICFP